MALRTLSSYGRGVRYYARVLQRSVRVAQAHKKAPASFKSSSILELISSPLEILGARPRLRIDFSCTATDHTCGIVYLQKHLMQDHIHFAGQDFDYLRLERGLVRGTPIFYDLHIGPAAYPPCFEGGVICLSWTCIARFKFTVTVFHLYPTLSSIWTHIKNFQP